MPIYATKMGGPDRAEVTDPTVGQAGYNSRNQKVYWTGSKWSMTRPAGTAQPSKVHLYNTATGTNRASKEVGQAGTQQFLSGWLKAGNNGRDVRVGDYVNGKYVGEGEDPRYRKSNISKEKKMADYEERKAKAQKSADRRNILETKYGVHPRDATITGGTNHIKVIFTPEGVIRMDEDGMPTGPVMTMEEYQTLRRSLGKSGAPREYPDTPPNMWPPDYKPTPPGSPPPGPNPPNPNPPGPNPPSPNPPPNTGPPDQEDRDGGYETGGSPGWTTGFRWPTFTGGGNQTRNFFDDWLAGQGDMLAGYGPPTGEGSDWLPKGGPKLGADDGGGGGGDTGGGGGTGGGGDTGGGGTGGGGGGGGGSKYKNHLHADLQTWLSGLPLEQQASFDAFVDSTGMDPNQAIALFQQWLNSGSPAGQAYA